MSSIDALKQMLSECEIDWFYREFSPHDLLLSEIIDNLKLRVKLRNKTRKCKVFVNFQDVEKNDDVFTVNVTVSNMTVFPHIIYTSVGKVIMMILLIDEYIEYFRNAGWIRKLKHLPGSPRRYVYEIGNSYAPYRFYWYYLSSGQWCLKVPCRNDLYLLLPERVKYLSCLDPFAYLGLRGMIPGIKPSKLLDYRLSSFAEKYKVSNVGELFNKIREHIIAVPCNFPIVNEIDGYVKFIKLAGRLESLFELYTFCSSYLGSPLLLKSGSKVYIQSESELVLRVVLKQILEGSLFGKKGVFLCGAPQFRCAFFALSE